MILHLREDFFHNGRPCGTTEAISIKHAISLHERRGWTLRTTKRTRPYGTSVFTADFDSPTSNETSTLRFRFSAILA